MIKEKDTPLSLVRKWFREDPRVWKFLDDLHDSGVEETPDYCPLPISAAMAVLTISLGKTRLRAAQEAAELIACWGWRKRKVIYSFDKDLEDMLAQQVDDIKDSDSIPSELLLHPPYPVIYIKCHRKYRYTDVDGFFYWVEYDTITNVPEARIQWVDKTFRKSSPFAIHLVPGGTIYDATKEYFNMAESNLKRLQFPKNLDPIAELRPELEAIQLVLYVLASNADVEPTRSTVPKKRKTERIMDTAKEIDVYDVGVRIGGAIRKNKAGVRESPRSDGSSGEGGRHRPHPRRGHWHHYWIGPRTGTRTLILKWVAPTYIHVEDADPDEDRIVLYPVKK